VHAGILRVLAADLAAEELRELRKIGAVALDGESLKCFSSLRYSRNCLTSGGKFFSVVGGAGNGAAGAMFMGSRAARKAICSHLPQRGDRASCGPIASRSSAHEQ